MPSTFTPLELPQLEFPFDPREVAAGALDYAIQIFGLMIQQYPWFVLVILFAVVVSWKSILRGIGRMLVEAILD